jgi:transcriptional regulator with XRE-family HTH domain
LSNAPPISAFGRELPALRKKLGISQKALAVAAGLSPAAVSKIEAGYYNPSAEVIERIMLALKENNT